jgi:DNA-binding LacI/PurR family transcriptional regulator
MDIKHATVKEIARRARVSIGTLDRVLHDRGEVSADTKARLEAIIPSLGYKPNVLARRLSLDRHHVPRVGWASQDSSRPSRRAGRKQGRLDLPIEL